MGETRRAVRTVDGEPLTGHGIGEFAYWLRMERLPGRPATRISCHSSPPLCRL